MPRLCASCGTENPAQARFCFSCGAPLEAPAPAAETRKTVTVLFCDLVGSTALGEQIDPETLRSLLGRSFDTVSAIVERHGGVVEKFIGDAAMAVFGIPRVHEDDALRAVRAAADIRDALAEAAVGGATAAIAWRTGIATGEVVAGDATSGQRLVTGDAVNVAARLQQSAQPGEILITGETLRLVRDAIQVEPLGEVSVKGRQAPIEGYRMLEVDRAAAGHERRLDSPMVGRGRPRRLLDEAFAEARDERICHLFTILGAAGVGKSRLVNEFLASLGDQVRVLRGRCLSYGEGITYWPIGEIVRDAIGIGSSADPADEVARIRTVLGSGADGDRIADVVAQAIGLTRGETSADETPWAVRSFLEALARERPLVVVLDDLQWAEPPLLDLVEHVADWSRDAPILLIVMARQELLDGRPAWGGGKRSATSISLEPLDADETTQLIDNLLDRAELPPTVFDRIRGAAEGNPLFVEELLEMLIDEGALARTDGGWVARQDLSSLAVPPTIQALLAARLDGLASSERAVLERGAVEGTVFHRDAVTALAPEAIREGIGSSLMTLTRREFVAPDRAELAGREAFRFRHQLIRDAAYQAIAKQNRADLHERFADWLESALGDRIDEYRPILGYHLEQAARYRRDLDPSDPALPDLERRAIDQLADAGIAALERGDSTAAASLLQHVVALIGNDESAAIGWRLLAGEALVRAASAHESNQFLLDTQEMALRVGDRRAAAVAEALRLHVRSAMGEQIGDLRADGERIRAELLALDDQAGAGRAGLELAKVLFWSGQAGQALDLAEVVRESPDTPSRLRHETIAWQLSFAFWGPTPVPEVLALTEGYLADPNVPRLIALRGVRGLCCLLAMLGRHDEARQAAQTAISLHEGFGDYILIGSLKGHFMAPSRFFAGAFEEAAELGIESYELLMARGLEGFANTAAGRVARAMLEMGRDQEAEEWAQRAFELGAEDDPAAAGPALGVRARVHARRGEIDALDLADRALAVCEGTDHLDFLGDAHADRAHVLHALGRRVEAVLELEAALALYERKGNLVSAANTRRLLDEWGRGAAA